jgi:hypothetical protein
MIVAKGTLRLISPLALVFLISCAGMNGVTGVSAIPNRLAEHRVNRHSSASLRLHIPKQRHRRGMRPATISPLTQSVQIVVNGTAPQIFNTTPASPDCSTDATGTTCSFLVQASTGTDSFVVTTYSGVGATGYALDQARAIVTVLPKSSTPVLITLGPVVSNTNDSGAGSLRQAIADANPGDTITSVLDGTSTIALQSPITLSKDVTLAGPGASSLVVSGGNAVRLFIVKSGVTATISGVSMTQGSATGATSNVGGAISNAGNLTLNADVLSRSVAESSSSSSRRRAPAVELHFNARPRSRGARAPRHPSAIRLRRPRQLGSGEGGAVYNTGSLTATNTTFSANSAGEGSGGAIYNGSGATLALSGSLFTNNAAALGGAIDNEGTATLSSDTFKSNAGWAGSSSSSSQAYGYGAAIYANGKESIDASSFSGNTAGGSSAQSYGVGGAIAQFGGTLSITNSQFVNNVAGGGTNGSWGYGGAVYFDGSGQPELDNDTFKSNVAGADGFGYGGAVFVEEALNGSNDVFNKNTATGTASGYAYGGAIYAENGLSLTSSSFAGNSVVAGSGGAVYGGALDSEFNSTLSTVTFTNNAATAGSGGTAEGGAILVDNGTSTWQAMSCSNNSATAQGSSSYAAGGAAAIFGSTTASGTFNSNQATASGNNTLGGVGGGIAVEVGPFAFTGTSANNSSSTEGGALWLDDTAAVNASSIFGNAVTAVAAPQDGGGGIYNALGGTLSLTSTTVNANTTSGGVPGTGGGGIFSLGAATISNSTVAFNTSSVDGGGIENVASGGFALINVTVYQNDAVAPTGGNNLKNLYSDSAMTVANSILAGGGGTISGADISNDGTITSKNYNIIQTAPVGAGTMNGQTGANLQVDPQLLGLSNNGGPTKTIGDTGSSPGTRYIPYSSCSALGITVDQRGFDRNVNNNGFCDVGAFENQNISSR